MKSSTSLRASDPRAATLDESLTHKMFFFQDLPSRQRALRPARCDACTFGGGPGQSMPRGSRTADWEGRMDIGTADGTDTKLLDGILASRSQVSSNDLSPLLQEIQLAYGYLPREVLMELSRRTGIPASQIYGVATFYEQFHLEPRGRHTVRCCRGTACHVRGGHSMIEAISNELGIEEGHTTEDKRFTFETVACLGTCFLAPVIMVNGDYYGNINTSMIKGIVERYK